jgi:uncharacterized membrane protein YkvA (DUF1232 family)
VPSLATLGVDRYAAGKVPTARHVGCAPNAQGRYLAYSRSDSALWVVLLVVFWALRPKNVSARQILTVVPDVLRLLRSIITDATAPFDVRIALVGLLAWIVSPIDLIPEFIPALGPLDDVVVAVVAMRYVRRRLGVADLRRRWVGSDDGFALLLRVIGAE